MSDLWGLENVCACPSHPCAALASPTDWASPTTCPYTVNVRLVNGTSSNSGRLELAVNGLWGTAVASKQFDSAAADVVCRQLGLPTPGRTLPGGSFGPGPAGGPLWLRSLFCTGSEARLQDCRTGRDDLVWGVAPEAGYDRTAAVALACGFP